MISPNNVIMTVEKKNAPSPARTEPDSSVRKTLVPTLPQITVASTSLDFFRRSRTRAASLLPPSASICRRNWLRLKIARLRPANSADSVMQATMPSQIQTWDVRHRTFSRQVSQRPRHAYRVTASCGRCAKRARPASSRRWQEFCRRRRIDNALSARAIIVPKLLVAEINEGADHEGEG